MAEHGVEVPALGVLADRTRADETRDLDGDADLIGDLENGLDVGDDGARGAVGRDAEVLVADFLGHPFDVGALPGGGARETEIGGIDAELDHQMEDAQLLFDAGIARRGRLDPVAQGLVVELAPRRQRSRLLRVPVVNELGFPR